MLCDCNTFLPGAGQLIPLHGIAVERVHLTNVRSLACLYDRENRYFTLSSFDRFREGEEHPSVAALLGPLDGKSEETPDGK